MMVRLPTHLIDPRLHHRSNMGYRPRNERCGDGSGRRLLDPDITRSDGTNDVTFDGRVLPRLAIDARFPFVRHSDDLKQVVRANRLGHNGPKRL